MIADVIVGGVSGIALGLGGMLLLYRYGAGRWPWK